MSFNKANKNRVKVMGFWSFFLLILAGPLLMNVVDNSVQVGYISIPLYGIAALVYVIPYSLIMSEFASIKKIQGNESGYTAWITYAAGRKMGYLASWAYFFVNLFYFLSLVPRLITFLLITITGDDQIMANLIPDPQKLQLVLMLFSLSIFWLSTFVSMKGAKPLAVAGNYAGLARLFIAILFIVIGIFVTFLFINHGIPQTPFDSNNFVGKVWVDGQAQSQDTWTLIGTMSWILMAVGGQESVSGYINDTKGGAKTFARAIILVCIVSIIIYILGSLTVGLVVSREQLFKNGLSSGIFYAISQLFPNSEIWKLISLRVVGICLCVGTLSTLLLWTAAPVKIFFSEVPEGVMGKWLAKVDDNGTPINALMLQGIIVTILFIVSIIPVYVAPVGTNPSDALNTYMTILKTITAATSLLPMVLLFGSYAYFRLTKDNTERSIKFFKNKYVAIGITIVILLIFLIAAVTSVIPSPQMWKADIGDAILNLSLALGGMILFMGFAWYMWYQYERKIIKGLIIDNSNIIKYWELKEEYKKNNCYLKNKNYVPSKIIKLLTKYEAIREKNLQCLSEKINKK